MTIQKDHPIHYLVVCMVFQTLVMSTLVFPPHLPKTLLELIQTTVLVMPMMGLLWTVISNINRIREREVY